MRVLFAGGGTGGHIYPLVAVAEELFRRGGHEILWLGREESREKRIAEENKIPFRSIPAGRIVRKWMLENLATPWKVIQGISASSVAIHTFQPEAILSSAGYVSFAPILAARWAGIPIILLEQNVIPGLVNRLLSNFAERIVLHFPESEKYFSKEKRTVIGNPIRAASKNAPREESARYLGIDPEKQTVLFAGGSLGALCINTIANNVADKLIAKNIQVILWSGEGEILPSDKMILKPFEKEVGKALGCVDLVVSRAGGTWTAEILAAGIPSILIPFPYASENHQKANAKALEDAGCARMLEQSKLQPETVIDIIFQILNDKKQWNEMKKNCSRRARPDAARQVADILLSR